MYNKYCFVRICQKTNGITTPKVNHEYLPVFCKVKFLLIQYVYHVMNKYVHDV